MNSFHSAREAKEYLISKIVTEAQIEGISLSDVERKMLYFSESGWTLPDIMEVNDAFDREYDNSEYERKIAKLIRGADKHARKATAEEYESWWSAILFLRKEDHYILVMIRIAGLRPKGDQLRLFLSALSIVTCLFLIAFLPAKFRIGLSRDLPSKEAVSFFTWIAVVCVAVGYSLFRFVVGGRKADQMAGNVVDKLARIWTRGTLASLAGRWR
jgi:hypothetical protein